MEINANQEQGIQVMSLVGSFDTASAVETEPEFIEQIGDGSGKFLVDFSEVPYIASSGLRILLKMAQAIKVGGGHYIFVHSTTSFVKSSKYPASTRYSMWQITKNRYLAHWDSEPFQTDLKALTDQ